MSEDPIHPKIRLTNVTRGKPNSLSEAVHNLCYTAFVSRPAPRAPGEMPTWEPRDEEEAKRLFDALLLGYFERASAGAMEEREEAEAAEATLDDLQEEGAIRSAADFARGLAAAAFLHRGLLHRRDKKRSALSIVRAQIGHFSVLRNHALRWLELPEDRKARMPAGTAANEAIHNELRRCAESGVGTFKKIAFQNF